MESPANDNVPIEANDNKSSPFGKTVEAQWGRLASTTAKLGRFHMLATKTIAKHDEEQAEKMRSMKVVNIETVIAKKIPDLHDHLLKAMELQLKDADAWLTDPASYNKTPEEIEQFTKQLEIMISDNLIYFPSITEQDLNPHEAEIIPLPTKDK